MSICIFRESTTCFLHFETLQKANLPCCWRSLRTLWVILTEWMGGLWFISRTKRYFPKLREKIRIFKLYLVGQEKLGFSSEKKQKYPNLLSLPSIRSEISKQNTDSMYFSLKFFQLFTCHEENLVNEDPFDPHPWLLPDRRDVTPDAFLKKSTTLLWRQDEEVGVVQPGENKASHTRLPVPKESL